ncbi:hypothetical protein Clacol_005658 [Clathrus columnatus]|uniref:Arrestin-like N-terminal domain-containing protein n=1 Tax=Clathrus columnatus TaxID=1419009 RepID=A0AAV5AHL2_9AGAM|nr:hypothetical protein Clacol_005658 [Clathrus columnatus]
MFPSSPLPGYESEDRHDDDRLPTYTPAPPTPGYTASPRPNEARINLATATRQSRTDDLNHVFVERTKHFSLTFTNQPASCARPTYGRGTAIQGLINIFKTDDVASVVVKFEARMFYSISTETGSGENDISLIEENLKVFPQVTTLNPASPSNSRRHSNFFSRVPQPLSEACPPELSFSLRIPFSYSYDGSSYLLPPTYSADVNFRDGASVKIRYSFKVTIGRKGPLVDRKTSIVIPIIYAPRSRPSKPIMDIFPEDWSVYYSESGVRKGFSSNIDVVQAFLALPHSQIYPIDTRIQFYLQLWSISPSTLAMYAQEPPTLGRSQTESNPRAVRVELVVLRSIKVDMLQRTLKFYQTLASASIRRYEHELPPTVRTAMERVQASRGLAGPLSVQNGNGCMSWEGQFTISKDEPLWGGCAGFLAPNVFVRDLIALRVIPPNYKDYPLKRIEQFIPIRLTTDPYGEELIHGMEIAAGHSVHCLGTPDSPVPSRKGGAFLSAGRA